jgi:hypothetical protein
VSVLKEEKRLILLQVKAGEAEKNKMVSQMKEDKLPKLLPLSLGDMTNGKVELYLCSKITFVGKLIKNCFAYGTFSVEYGSDFWPDLRLKAVFSVK